PGEVLRNDPVREERDVGDERRPLELEMKDDGARMGGRDALDRGVEISPALRLRPSVVDRELDVCRRHGLSVRELDALAQLEGVRLAVLRFRVARREPRLERLAVVPGLEERLVDLLGD